MPITHDSYKVRLAVQHIEDIFDRLICNFVLTGEIARCAKESLIPEISKVQVAVRDLEFTQQKRDTMKTLWPDVIFKGNKIFLEFEDVPIEVKMLKNEYDFILYPEQVSFLHWKYNIPNQWDKYWKMRNLVR